MRRLDHDDDRPGTLTLIIEGALFLLAILIWLGIAAMLHT